MVLASIRYFHYQYVGVLAGPPPSVIRVKINQTAIGWLAVLHNRTSLVHVARVLGLELS